MPRVVTKDPDTFLFNPLGIKQVKQLLTDKEPGRVHRSLWARSRMACSAGSELIVEQVYVT